MVLGGGEGLRRSGTIKWSLSDSGMTRESGTSTSIDKMDIRRSGSGLVGGENQNVRPSSSSRFLASSLLLSASSTKRIMSADQAKELAIEYEC